MKRILLLTIITSLFITINFNSHALTKSKTISLGNQAEVGNIIDDKIDGGLFYTVEVSNSEHGYYTRIIKYNTNLSKVWERNLTSAAGYNHQVSVKDIVKLDNGKYLVVGTASKKPRRGDDQAGGAFAVVIDPLNVGGSNPGRVIPPTGIDAAGKYRHRAYFRRIFKVGNVYKLKGYVGDFDRDEEAPWRNYFDRPWDINDYQHFTVDADLTGKLQNGTGSLGASNITYSSMRYYTSSRVPNSVLSASKSRSNGSRWRARIGKTNGSTTNPYTGVGNSYGVGYYDDSSYACAVTTERGKVYIDKFSTSGSKVSGKTLTMSRTLSYHRTTNLGKVAKYKNDLMILASSAEVAIVDATTLELKEILNEGGKHTWSMVFNNGALFVLYGDSISGGATERIVKYTFNAAPTAPTITAPTNGLKTSDNTVTVNWNFNDPDSGDTQSKYRVQGSTNNFSTIHYESGTISSSAKTRTTTALADGNWKFRIMTWDAAGEASPWSSHRSFMVDTTPPTLTYGYVSGARYVSGKNYWAKNGDTVKFYVQGVDNGAGVKRVYLIADHGSNNPYRAHYSSGTETNAGTHDKIKITDSVSNTNGGGVLKATFDVLINTSENLTAEIKSIADDLADTRNRSGWSDANGLRLKIDNVIPTAPTINVDSSWQNTNVNFTVTGGTDSLSGVARREYKIGSGAWTTYSSAVTVSTEGITTVYARTVDNVGNVSAQVSKQVKIDKTKPTASFSPNNTSGWTNSNVGVTYTPSDNLSGVKVYKEAYSTNGGSTYGGWYAEETGVSSSTLSAEGHRKIKIYIEDNAGNSNTVYSGDYYIDKTVPTMTYGYASGARYVDGVDYWIKNGDAIKFWVQGIDNDAGMRRVYVRVRYEAENPYRMHAFNGTEANENIHNKFKITDSVDNVNNGNTLKATFDILLDTTEDVIGGIEVITDDLASPYNRTGGTWIDTSYRVKTDNTNPTVPTINVDSSWQNTDVNFTITGGSDTGSGVARREYKIESGSWQTYSSAVTISAEGTTTVYARTVDNVGNISAEVSRVINIDKTKATSPTITVDESWSKEDVSFAIVHGNSGLSGLLRTEYKLSGATTVDWTTYSSSVTVSNEGVTTVLARTIDTAGNISDEETKTVRVDKSIPTSISVDIIAVDMNGYEVEVKGALDSISGVNRVQFPTWSAAGGQDDLATDWHNNVTIRGTDMGSGTYRFRVDISDHGNIRGAYHTDVYIFDNAGNLHFAGGLTPYVNSEPVVTMSTDKAAYLKGETGKLNINISDVDVADTIDYSLSAGVYAVMLGRTSGVGKGSVAIDIDTSKFDINEFVWNGTRYEKDVQIDLSVTDHKGGLVNKAVTIKVYNNKPVVTQDTPLSKLKPFTHMDISGKVIDDSGETLIGKYFFYSPLDNTKKTAERFIKGFVSTGQEGYFDARIDYDKAYLDTIKDYLGGRDSEELTDVNLRLIVRDSNGGEGYADKLMKVKYNIVPDITVSDSLVYKKDNETLNITGTIVDADSDNMIIKGTIGGVEKTTTRVGAGAYTLSWNTSELLEGTYTGFKVSVDDQMGGSDDVTYTSNIVVDKTKPIGSFTPNSQGTWGKVDVAFRVDSSDNGPAGLEGANCQIRHSLDEGSTWTSWSGLTVPLYNGSLSPSDGKRMIEIKLVDKSGNENIIRSGVYLIDKTNPVLSIDSTEQGYDYIRADISAIDTLSGVKDYRVDLGSDIGSYGSDTSKNFADLKSNKRYTLKAYVRDNVDNIHSLTRNITTYAVVPQIDVIDTEDNKVAVRVYTDDRNNVRPEVKIICINKADSSDTVEMAFTDKEIITVEGLTPAVNYKVDAVVKNIAGHEERKNVLDNIMFTSNDNDPVIHSFEINYGNATTTQSEIDMKLVASDDKTFEKDLRVQFDINGRKYGYDSDGSVWKENHFGDYQTYYGGFKLDGIGENRITATIVDEGSNKARLTKLVTYQTNTSKPVIVEKPTDTGSEVSDILYDEDGRILTRERLVKIEYSSSGDEFAVSKDSVVWSPWEKVKDSTILKYVELDEKVGIVKTVYVRVRDEAKAEGDIKVIYYLLDREGPDVNITTSNNIRIAKDGKVTLKLEAKDNVSKDLSYKITVKSESSEKVIEGKTNGATSILEPISGLKAGSYSVEVIVKDQLGNEGKASMNLWSK